MSNINWKAIHNDETVVTQRDGKKYTDIDRAQLNQFCLYDNDKLVLVVHLDKNKRLIYRRRVAKLMSKGTEEIIYFAGWQETVNGKNIQQISFLFEDGHIEIVDGFKEKHKWFYPIVFLDEEKI